MHLLLAPFLARIVLVEADEFAVVALVERLVPAFGQAGLPHLGQREGQRVLGADERRGKGKVECDAMRLEAPAGLLGLFDACRGQIHIAPAGEQVLEVPFALAMAQQDQETFVGSHLSFTVFEDSQARSRSTRNRRRRPENRP